MNKKANRDEKILKIKEHRKEVSISPKGSIKIVETYKEEYKQSH